MESPGQIAAHSGWRAVLPRRWTKEDSGGRPHCGRHQPTPGSGRGGGRRFRADLFHRLNQCQIRVPPLRERRDDIVPIAEHFLRQQAAEARFSAEPSVRWSRHSWPGNVRELRNAVIQAMVLARSYEIGVDDLPTLKPVGRREQSAGGGGLRPPWNWSCAGKGCDSCRTARDRRASTESCQSVGRFAPHIEPQVKTVLHRKRRKEESSHAL